MPSRSPKTIGYCSLAILIALYVVGAVSVPPGSSLSIASASKAIKCGHSRCKSSESTVTMPFAEFPCTAIAGEAIEILLKIALERDIEKYPRTAG